MHGDKQNAIRRKSITPSGKQMLQRSPASKSKSSSSKEDDFIDHSSVALQLPCGIEIRAYSLHDAREVSTSDIIARCISIAFCPLPYDPKKDLVAEDLKVIPAMVRSIDNSWQDTNSIEYITADALCNRLVKSMQVHSMLS